MVGTGEPLMLVTVVEPLKHPLVFGQPTPSVGMPVTFDDGFVPSSATQ